MIKAVITDLYKPSECVGTVRPNYTGLFPLYKPVPNLFFAPLPFASKYASARNELSAFELDDSVAVLDFVWPVRGAK